LAITVLLSFSYAQKKHVIGEKWGGGIVFMIDPDGHHGLIAETLDQGKVRWFDAKNICKTGKHSKAGKAFTDWRLPTKTELNEIYIHFFDSQGFTSGEYWSSTEDGPKYAWCEDLIDATQSTDYKDTFKDVRAVRAF
jgi:hypothetical protein